MSSSQNTLTLDLITKAALLQHPKARDVHYFNTPKALKAYWFASSTVILARAHMSAEKNILPIYQRTKIGRPPGK